MKYKLINSQTMKYKLINSQTGETHLCNKVTIDGFDYYVNDELPKDNDSYWIYIGFNEPLEVVKSNQPQGWFEKLWDKANYKTPIATNNPSIDISKVVDEVEVLANIEYPFAFGEIGNLENISKNHFIKGYNKSQETHPFSEGDTVEFAEWLKETTSSIAYKDESCPRLYKKSTKELLQLWKEQQTKTLYYE